ncbi:MAG: DUF3794 domain-containing protein [Clostridia bacterium]|nr:DUF3794 domain-containing protein [Clostridia bacterium]
MVLEYSTEKMGIINNLFEGSCEQAVDLDVSLPDYCPDISRLLKCCVMPSIVSAKISGDRACADGNALVRIIYSDEENNICTYEQNFPFSKFVQLGADTSGTLSAEACVQYTNCRAVSKRRIEVHSMLQLIFKITAVSDCETVNEINRKTVQAKTEEISFSNLCAVECKMFSVSETVELPSDYLPAERVVSYCATPVLNDVRVVQDKILIKGEVDITLIYCPADNGGESVRFNHTIPINQVADAQGITESATTAVRLKMLGCECNVRNDANSNPRLIEINCNISAQIKAYCEEKLNCITDAYCIDGHLRASYEQREIMSLCDKVHETSMQKFSVDLSSLDAQKICCLWWDSPKVNKNIHDGKLSLHTTVPMNIIAQDSDGRPVFCEREVDFEFSKAVDISGCAVCDEAVTPLGFSAGTVSDGKAEIKGEFSVDAEVFALRSINALVSADITAADSKPSACIIVYFPDEEESLWNIARRFNTTVDMIKEQNTLSGERAKNGTPLLIPVICS